LLRFSATVAKLDKELLQSKYVDTDLHQRKFKLVSKYRSIVEDLSAYVSNHSPTNPEIFASLGDASDSEVEEVSEASEWDGDSDSD
jgi:hypothetical protein